MLPKKKRLYLILAAAAVLLGSAAGIILIHTGEMPQVDALEGYKPSATTRVFADDGQLLAEFYMENRIPVVLSQVPPHVVNAFLATEDPRFYRHSGIDFSGIARAVVKNVSARRVVQGGSSITQQLAKLLFLTPDKTFTRKIKEAVLALELERRYSKDEILQLYLNQVYLGSGAYGVEAAAKRYFGKQAFDLDLAQGALIAGLPAAPNKFSPINNIERAYTRRRHVLRRMAEEGFITREQMASADAEKIVITPARPDEWKAPYFVEYVRQRLEEKYGTGTLYRGGLNVYTTLNLKMQEMAEAAMIKGLDRVGARHPRKDGKEVQGAFLAVEPQSGYIKAMVGGRDFEKSEFNRATQALRQPGSAFKPVVYTAALDSGLTPDDVMLDAPVSYPGARPGVPWRPSNFDGKFEGEITLRRAIARSVNVIAVKLIEKVGVPKVVEYARRMGINSPLSPYLPLALGASDVTLMEMTGAFTVFNNQGVYTVPTAIEKITDRAGGVVEDNIPMTVQAISPDTAATMTDMLAGVVRYGTAYQAKSLGHPAAGKTGTTSDYKDAWFIGFIPSITVGVWVGHDDHKPIGERETGSQAALPIWLDFMKGYVDEFNIPAEQFMAPPPAVFVNATGAAEEPAVEEVDFEVGVGQPPEDGGFPEESPAGDETEMPEGGLPDLRGAR